MSQRTNRRGQIVHEVRGWMGQVGWFVRSLELVTLLGLLTLHEICMGLILRWEFRMLM
jgi:hypothetical protein